MNKLKLSIIFFSFLFSIISCQKDPPIPQNPTTSIRGKWAFKWAYATEFKISTNQVLVRDTTYIPDDWPGSYFDFRTSEKMYAYLDGHNEIWDYKLANNNKIEFIDYPGGGHKFTFDIQKLQTDILVMKAYDVNNTDPTIREEILLYCEKW